MNYDKVVKVSGSIFLLLSIKQEYYIFMYYRGLPDGIFVGVDDIGVPVVLHNAGIYHSRPISTLLHPWHMEGMVLLLTMASIIFILVEIGGWVEIGGKAIFTILSFGVVLLLISKSSLHTAFVMQFAYYGYDMYQYGALVVGSGFYLYLSGTAAIALSIVLEGEI